MAGARASFLRGAPGGSKVNPPTGHPQPDAGETGLHLVLSIQGRDGMSRVGLHRF